VSARRGGRAPDELSDEQVRRLGRLVARLHNVGARGDAPSRLRLDADTFVREPVAWLRRHEAVPAPFRDRYFATAEQIAEIADRRMSGCACHRLHGDLHLGNLLFRDEELRILDFDDMAVGPAVQDLWLMLPGRDPESLRQRQVLIEAYEQLRVFDHGSLRLVEPLRALRMVHFAAWLARRFDDPAFRAAWPEFGTEDYWRHESDDLEEQLRYIQGETTEDWYGAPSGSQPLGAEDGMVQVLSNKDYFWDWEGD
jgi:Ser/Thr protein kinase RdoA (MazF antagonist)